MLELFERTSSLLAKLELDEQTKQAENVLIGIKRKFDITCDENCQQSEKDKAKNFEQLRPTLGHPARKNELQEIDNHEKQRENELQQLISDLRSKTIVSALFREQITEHKTYFFLEKYSNRCTGDHPYLSNKCRTVVDYVR